MVPPQVGDFPAGSYNASIFLRTGRALSNPIGGGILVVGVGCTFRRCSACAIKGSSIAP